MIFFFILLFTPTPNLTTVLQSCINEDNQYLMTVLILVNTY